MQKLIKQNIDFILSKNGQKTDISLIKRIIENLNRKSLIIISGTKNVWKVNVLKELLTRTSTTQSFFYFNKNIDKENKIKSSSDINELLNIFIKEYKTPQIIILHNTNKVDGIKNFISKIYKEKNSKNKPKYKIILLWNNIKINGIEDVEIASKNSNQILEEESGNIESISKYGTLEKVRSFVSWEESFLKENYIELIKNDILLNDIFNTFSVKNIDLYNYTLSYLSKNNIFLSLRDLQKNLDINKSISLKTTMDYIDFSVQSKIIRKMYKYDIKTGKHISSKVKYYFTDLWIRNACNNFSVERHTLLENLIFNDLYTLNYEIYWWMNGKFDFSFIAKSNDKKIYIHLSRQTEKEEIKKEVRKLLKIWGDQDKYLIVEDIRDLWLKKTKYETVEILTLVDFLKKIRT